jgi:polyhydroxyalkanoate synthesis regulator phasin
MMKNILSKKVIMLVSALSISGLLLTGCSSANKNDVAQASTQNQQSQQGQQGNSNFAANAEERKKQMETDVNALVSDGTLTKDQGTKVLEALTTLNQRPNGQGRGNNAQGSNGQGTQNNNQGSTTQNGENSQQGQGTKNGNGTKSNRGNFNPLSKLVSDGVITQDQATKVMEKVKADMPNRQRQNNNGTNNGTNSNSNSNSNGTNNNSSSDTGSSS